MHTLIALFGAPAAIAGQHTLTAKAHALLASWLRCAEALLRHLLLIEAAALTLKPARARPNRTRPPRADAQFNPDDPQTWRVSFRCFSSPVRGGSVSAQCAMTMGAAAPSVACGATRFLSALGGGKRFFSAIPLARRFEAVLRAFNDPTPYAHRLARTLRAAPQRVRSALRASPEAEHRIDHWDALKHGTSIAALRFNNSS